jgi:hypothetical protein
MLLDTGVGGSRPLYSADGLTSDEFFGVTGSVFSLVNAMRSFINPMNRLSSLKYLDFNEGGGHLRILRSCWKSSWYWVNARMEE